MGKKTSKIQKIQKIQITDKEGKLKQLGKYNTETRVFTCSVTREEAYDEASKSWKIDSQALKFLVQNLAKIELRDKDTKWIYRCEAVDFKIDEKYVTRKGERQKHLLPVLQWEVIKAKDKSSVIECLEIDCKHNFGNQCLNGVIKINRNGSCGSYEDRV